MNVEDVEDVKESKSREKAANDFLLQVRDINATPDLFMTGYPKKKFTVSAYAHDYLYSRIMKKTMSRTVIKEKSVTVDEEDSVSV
jgi:hypothetical protein